MLRPLLPALAALVLVACRGETPEPPPSAAPSAESQTLRAASPFLAERALADVRYQLAAGPRVPGTPAHARIATWLDSTLRDLTDSVVRQDWTHVTATGDTLPLTNIWARFGPDTGERVLYIAHWDTRPVAEKDADPANRTQPIAGAVDGATATAMLLEVARALEEKPPAMGVDILLVDGEDWGDFDRDTDVLIGSRYAVANPGFPGTRYAWGVVWDLVGARGATYAQETRSIKEAPAMIQAIWPVAYALGYQSLFREAVVGPMIDDHIPFLDAGIPVGVVIAWPFAEHHTSRDTFEAIDPELFRATGDVATMRLYATPRR